MSVRSIEEWVSILEPLGYWQAAPEILKNLSAYPADVSERNRDHDARQVGNALVAWAMIAAKEIQEDLAPEPEPDFLRRALDQLGKRVGA